MQYIFRLSDFRNSAMCFRRCFQNFNLFDFKIFVFFCFVVSRVCPVISKVTLVKRFYLQMHPVTCVWNIILLILYSIFTDQNCEAFILKYNTSAQNSNFANLQLDQFLLALLLDRSTRNITSLWHFFELFITSRHVEKTIIYFHHLKCKCLAG